MIMQAVIKYMLTAVLSTETHMIMQAVGRGLLRSYRKNIGSRINDYAGCDQIHVNVLSRLSID